jgi:GT2 family glycosyltransferase
VSPEPEMAERPVPHNRWDLIPDGPADPPPPVCVVVVHYEQDRALARVLHALGRQSALPFEIVVADDGSRTPPVLPDLPVPARVVTQPDLGFRAAAARNAGARVCRGDILVFLDADTTPEETCLAQLTRRVGRCRDVLAVGRRRHADLSHLPVDADPASAPGLVEPEWLRSGYAQTRDLLDADGRSFRFVISAVMACRRDLYRDLGGFDERFVGYGGEDWDFAYRAWNAGAVLVHEPEAVAWHDGPGWADRPSSADTPDRQSARLAALIPEPSTRGVALPGCRCHRWRHLSGWNHRAVRAFAAPPELPGSAGAPAPASGPGGGGALRRWHPGLPVEWGPDPPGPGPPGGAPPAAGQCGGGRHAPDHR